MRPPEPPPDDRGPVLLRLARASVAEALGLATAPAPPDPPWLAAPGATVVTLRRAGRLRGCGGSVRARRPLGDDVRANARAAAFHDPRFPPLTAAEWEGLAFEVSLLSTPVPLRAASEEEVLAALRPGEDGVILEEGTARATFLPQVWESLVTPEAFLAELKRKAGLPAGYWSADVRVWRYAVERWEE
ncbi:MAG TPA: AmmeMemoRadiSam system protein A [Thermoanaerobaculia bacterium]